MIDKEAPKDILELYENARSKINQAKIRAEETASAEELDNITWFERILNTAASLIGPDGMEITQAKGMFRTLNDCEPLTPRDAKAAVDAFAEAVMKHARRRSESLHV